ncbi:hypothetical protein QTP88_020220 [Uroleucon formosanum]
MNCGACTKDTNRWVKQEVNRRKKEIQGVIVFGQSIKDFEIGLGERRIKFFYQRPCWFLCMAHKQILIVYSSKKGLENSNNSTDKA